MAPGNGGELVASGITPAGIQSPDPAVTSQRYPAPALKGHFRIQANFLSVALTAGSYWINVAPGGIDTAFADPTLGANAVGLDANGPRLALVDRTTGPRFAIAGLPAVPVKSAGRGTSARASSSADSGADLLVCLLEPLEAGDF